MTIKTERVKCADGITTAHGYTLHMQAVFVGTFMVLGVDFLVLDLPSA